MRAFVLGSGANELVCAILLAKQGHDVTVLEPGPRFGGTAALREICPGFRAPVTPEHWVAPSVARAVGLDVGSAWGETTVTSLAASGGPLTLTTDLGRSRAAVAKRSAADAGKLGAFATRMARLAGFLESLYLEEPPRLMSEHAGDLFSLMAVGLRLRRLGKVDMIELLRTLPMSVSDLLDDWFEDDALKAAIGVAGVTNLLQGPRSAGTCLVMLHHLVGRPVGGFGARRVVRGERDHLAAGLVGLAKSAGVKLRAGVEARVMVEDGRAVGVTVDGKEERAEMVVSGADPKATFARWVDHTALEPETVRAVGNVKLRGVRAVVNLAVTALPKLAGLDEAALAGVVVNAPNLDFIERAYDDAKHGGISKHPLVEITIPSIHDASLAPAKKHVVSVAVQYVPHRLKHGTWDAAAFGDRIVAMLEELAPGFAATVEGRAVWGPTELAAEYGLTEGHLYGGELTLDQILFMRPLPGYAHYRSPIDGLFMCGDACHPGGALPGVAGANAAREITRGV